MRAYWLLVFPLAGLVGAVVPARPRAALPVGGSRVPVIVELFTSEGCSSCPAADAALRELENTQSVPGVEVIALGEHIDYWNRLGWRDVFSSSVYTERQRQYAAGFVTGSYTPQAVVNGRYEFVGSRTAELAATVANAAEMPQASVSITATGGTAQVCVSSLPANTTAAQVVLVSTESGLASQVGWGENSGRLLRHASVVRQLSVLSKVGADGTFAAISELRLNPDWKRTNLRAAALAQEITSRRVVGAATVSLTN